MTSFYSYKARLNAIADYMEQLENFDDAKFLRELSDGPRESPEHAPDTVALLVDAERYRWLRDDCDHERRVEIAEVADKPYLLDHHIDKGRCGL